jgi:hypothetical protein
MKKLALLFTFIAASCFANVHFPDGGNGSVYHVDQFGSSKSKKKSLKIKSIETMTPPKTEILPDYRPGR